PSLEAARPELLLRLFGQASDLFPDGAFWEHVEYPSPNLLVSYQSLLNVTSSILPSDSLSSRHLRAESESRKNLRLALCGLNAIQAVVTPGQIATNINNAAGACQPPYPTNASQRDFCAAMVSLDLALWGFLAIYIEGANLACSPTFNIKAACALPVTGVLASAAVVTSAGATIRNQ
ncbi:unnamed protein product, partial [Symbiodinium pilosum]